MTDVIGTPALRAEFDGRELVKGARDTGAKLKTTFENSNRAVEAVQRNASRRIQGLISQINAEKPRRQMFELGQAVQHMGGVAALSEQQVARLRVQVERLTAAGAKAPKSLAGLVPAAGATSPLAQLAAAAGGQLGGNLGGVGTALAAIGPAGLAAAAGVGAVTLAAGAAARAVQNLASEAEGWSNIADATGISIESIQRLQDYLVDAGFEAGALELIMKRLQVAVEGDGKAFEKFGIDLARIKNLAPEEQLREIAKAITSIEDPTRRAAAAQELLGRSGAQHMAALRGIATGAYTELHALSEQQIEDLKRIDDRLDAAGRAWENWKKRALVAMLDVVSGTPAVGQRVEDFSPAYMGTAGGARMPRWAAPMSPGALATISNPETYRKKTSLWEDLGLDSAEAVAARKAAAEETTKTRKSEEDLTAARVKAQDAAAKAAKAEELRAAIGPALAKEFQEILLEGMRTRVPQAPTYAGNLVGGLGPDQLERAAAGYQATYQAAIRLVEGAAKAGLGVDQIRHKLEGMGLTAEDAASIADQWMSTQADAGAQTNTWTDQLGSLSDQLQTLAQTTNGLAGDIASFAAALVSGIGSAIKGFNQIMSDTGKGFLGLLGKVSGGLEMLGGVVSTLSTAWSGIKGLGQKLGIGGDPVIMAVNDMRDAYFQQHGGWQSLQKELAKVTDRDLVKEIFNAKTVDQFNAAVAKVAQVLPDFATKMAGLEKAKGAAESLMERIRKGDLSAGLSAALQNVINRVGAAVYSQGLGILDARLAESEGFQAAQGTAGDLAAVMQGMRQAGMVDAGLLEATGAAAAEVKQQAIDAALAAGMSPEEAAKAGSAAIAPLLREQLNASIQSGNELDANTKALLEEAKANGIDILADPAIESLDVQRQQLDVLKDIAGKKGITVEAASGLGPVRMPNMGGGLGPIIQTHAGELALIIPAHMSRPGGIIQAAEGLYRARDDEDRDRRREPGEGPGTGVPDSPSGPSSTEPATPAEVEAAVERALRAAAPVVNFQNTQHVTANPFQSAESRTEALRIIMEEAANQLDANAGRFAAAIDRRIRERI